MTELSHKTISLPEIFPRFINVQPIEIMWYNPPCKYCSLYHSNVLDAKIHLIRRCKLLAYII